MYNPEMAMPFFGIFLVLALKMMYSKYGFIV